MSDCHCMANAMSFSKNNAVSCNKVDLETKSSWRYGIMADTVNTQKLPRLELKYGKGDLFTGSLFFNWPCLLHTCIFTGSLFYPKV